MGTLDWHTLEIREVVERFGSDLELGLGPEDVQRRLEKYGPNRIEERAAKSPAAILKDQFSGVMNLMLVLAVAGSVVLGEVTDAVVIAAILLLNAALGFSQEFRAEKAMVAMRRLAQPKVQVRRDGRDMEIAAEGIVPGDLMPLRAGDKVSADARIVEANALRTEESALTGESQPVDKHAHSHPAEDAPLADRLNMVYGGSTVTHGRGMAIVVATGMATEIGQIAGMIQGVRSEPTPLQRRFERFAQVLALVALALVALIFVMGLFQGRDFKTMVFIALSMAVAAVPEGLPAVVTVTLALGARRMLRRNALVRRLHAVETLGSVTVICADKTGTLTQNRMTVKVMDVAGHSFLFEEERKKRTDMGSEMAALNGEVSTADESLRLLLVGAALCNDAKLSGAHGEISAVGDPTEAALVVAAAQLGLHKHDLERAFPRHAEVPFSAPAKSMTTLHRHASEKPGAATGLRRFFRPALTASRSRIKNQKSKISPAWFSITKGAADELLRRSDHVWHDGQREALDRPLRDRIARDHDELAATGMRVLGVAFKNYEERPPDESLQGMEPDLTFVGMVALQDPLRPEVQEAVKACRQAGIRPIIITGDHPLTAFEIAKQLGIGEGSEVVTERELASAEGDALDALVERASVFARVSPVHKLKIVESLQRRGHIVAMTGDGVNDAPALKKADVGVALGIAGTEVAKEAADIVLLDDNFATIVAAVREGRAIYDNIRKFIRYVLASNAGELWVMLIGPFLGMSLPLNALQILWINLLTDGLPGLALSMERPEADTMRRKPHNPKDNVIDQEIALHILFVGVLVGLCPLALGAYYLWRGLPQWQTMIFTTLTIGQMAHVLAIRLHRRSVLTDFFSNRSLIGAVLATCILQYGLVYVPFMQKAFHVVPLTGRDIGVTLAAGLIVFFAVELEKMVFANHDHRRFA